MVICCTTKCQNTTSEFIFSALLSTYTHEHVSLSCFACQILYLWPSSSENIICNIHRPINVAVCPQVVGCTYPIILVNILSPDLYTKAKKHLNLHHFYCPLLSASHLSLWTRELADKEPSSSAPIGRWIEGVSLKSPGVLAFTLSLSGLWSCNVTFGRQ